MERTGSVCSRTEVELRGIWRRKRESCAIRTQCTEWALTMRLHERFLVDFRRRQLDSVQLKRHYESSSHRGAAKWDHERTAG
ncbi:hypothetical protein PC128_g6765 [Phytophthora cactorum]|nr:hypothetical protein PC128_g6765 [Phytophthora cactorum]